MGGDQASFTKRKQKQISAVKRLIASKINVFVYIAYMCVLCIFIMFI